MKSNPRMTDIQKLKLAACISIDTANDYIQFVEGFDGGVRAIAATDKDGITQYYPYVRTYGGFYDGEGWTVYTTGGTAVRFCHTHTQLRGKS